MIIDATNLVLGRLATKAAKAALLGEQVTVINCEKAVISGKKETVFKRYKQKQDMGIPAKGPFILRMPDRFVRRIIRGMLPYKQPRGAEAFKRITCFLGVPKEQEGKATSVLAEANSRKLPTGKFVTVKEVCTFLGAKVE